MTELDYFNFFEQNQLVSVDFNTGELSSKSLTYNKVFADIGSKNEEGYERVWCGSKTHHYLKPKLFMKHRLIYWLHHKYLPRDREIDHIDKNRSNNSINNLRLVDRATNCTGNSSKNVKGTYTDSDIHQICLLLQNTSYSDLTIAKLTGVSRAYVRDIKTRRRRMRISNQYQWSHRM